MENLMARDATITELFMPSLPLPNPQLLCPLTMHPWLFADCRIWGPGKKMGPSSQEAGGFWVTLGQNCFPSLGFIFSSAKLGVLFHELITT